MHVLHAHAYSLYVQSYPFTVGHMNPWQSSLSLCL